MITWQGVDRIIDFVKRNSGYKDLAEADIISWTGEAMAAMEVCATLKERVCFVEVRNKRAPIPNGTKYLIQLAKNHSWNKTWCTKESCRHGSHFLDDLTGCTPIKGLCCPETIVEDCPDGVPVDCQGNPIKGYQMAYYRPFFDLLWNYDAFTSSRYYNDNYTPIRLANHSFFRSMVCDCGPAYRSCEDEYTIHGDQLLFNFDSGSVAIAYLAPQTDDNGLPLVPDNQSFRMAIKSYISYIKATMLYETNPEMYQYKSLKESAEADWHWYCGQAKNWAWLPKTVDESQNLAEQRSYLIPPDNYYGFFGRMGRPEAGRAGINGSFVGSSMIYDSI